MSINIEDLIRFKESEDRIEFKEGKGGNISYNGGDKAEPKKRRRCILGYVIALANEGGGILAIGIKEGVGSKPHEIVGTSQNQGSIGELEGNIYRDTSIRVSIQELFDNKDKRVLMIQVPSRPIGKVYKFEDVPLMRVGEELKPMSDEKYLSIIKEQEPDFSQKTCNGVTIDDLDNNAIKVLQEAYSKKQKNEQFLTLNKEQVLNDLDLIQGREVTNAAVILVGKREIIKSKFPQSNIRLEYRKDEGKIVFDQRLEFDGPYYLEIEKLWDSINARNGSIPIQEGPYIFDIPYFNKEVIREAINNAIAHRNYHLTSETVIKQYPSKMDIISPGGFPLGVSIDNIISVSSTPRNRLLTEVLQKTGIVERSGQGVDKIYYQTLKEGKSAPDYSGSDDFQVELKLSAVIEDKAFALFIESLQSDSQKLSVHEILYLNAIRKGAKIASPNKEVLDKLHEKDLIEKRGKTSGTYYVLSKSYYEFSDEKGKYTKNDWDQNQIFMILLKHLDRFGKAKMKDFVDLFHGQLSRKQVRSAIDKLVEDKRLAKKGKGSGTYYVIGENYTEGMKIVKKALELGMKQLKENGDI